MAKPLLNKWFSSYTSFVFTGADATIVAASLKMLKAFFSLLSVLHNVKEHFYPPLSALVDRSMLT